MTAPLVTIGITAFNATETIAQAIESALAQTWRPIEIVVVDDCSRDETPALLAQLASKHREIRVFRNAENGGVAVARNRILKEARGEFIAFFDDDDQSKSERVAQQVQRISEYERYFSDGNMVICHTARTVMYPDGEQSYEPTMGQELACLAPAGEAVARRVLLGEPLKNGYGACPTCCQMARRETYAMLGGFDPQLRRGEDTEFTIRLALAGGHFVGIADPLVVQKMTKTSEKNLQEEYRNMLYILDKHRDFLTAHGQYLFSRRWLAVKQKFLEGRKLMFSFQMLFLSLRHPVLTVRRVRAALPNIALNRRFARFHKDQS